MKRRLPHILTILLAALLVVGAANLAAYGATGGKFLLGKSNKAGATTTLTKTGPGTALRLKSRGAPLAVSNSKKVARLNADKLDGKNAAALQTHSRVYRIPKQINQSSFEFTFGNLPPGVYQVSFSVIAHLSVSGGTINCHFRNTTGGFYELMGYGAAFGPYSTSNATGVIDTRSTPKRFRCFSSGGTVTTDFDEPNQSQVVFTRVDSRSSGNFVSPRRVPRAASPGAGR